MSRATRVETMARTLIAHIEATDNNSTPDMLAAMREDAAKKWREDHATRELVLEALDLAALHFKGSEL
jgi:hypothetical protein